MSIPKHHWRQLIVMLGFWFWSLALEGYAQTLAPQYGGTLLYRAQDEIRDLDPPLIEDSVTYAMAGNIFEGLVRYRGETDEIEPALAASWSVSPDGLRWRFKLRTGVKFHDHTPLNADAALFSFQRQMDEKHLYFNSHFIYKDVLFTHVASLKKIDEMTIEFQLSRPYSPFLHILTMPAAAIVSPQAVRANPAQFGKHPVGTGPFQLLEWTDQALVLGAFQTYWDGSPYLERVVVQPAKFLKTMLLAMRQGNLHLAAGATARELLWVQDDPEILLKQVPSNEITFVVFNLERPLLKEMKIRQALQKVLNKRLLVQWLWQGRALAANSPIPPQNWSHLELADITQDLQKARQLLQEAGYSQGLEIKLVTAIRRDPAWSRFFSTLIAACEAINLRIRLYTLPFEEYLQVIKAQEYDLAEMGWVTDHADPDGFIYPLLHSLNAQPGNLSNLAYYKNPHMDQLINEAQQINDPLQRKQLYGKIQTLLQEDPPWLPVMIPQRSYLYHRKLHNVLISVTGRVQLEKLWLEAH